MCQISHVLSRLSVFLYFVFRDFVLDARPANVPSSRDGLLVLRPNVVLFGVS